ATDIEGPDNNRMWCECFEKCRIGFGLHIFGRQMNMLHKEELSTEKTNTHRTGVERDVDLLKRAHIGCDSDNGSICATRRGRAISIQSLLFLHCFGNTRFDFVADSQVWIGMNDAERSVHCYGLCILELMDCTSEAKNSRNAMRARNDRNMRCGAAM